MVGINNAVLLEVIYLLLTVLMVSVLQETLLQLVPLPVMLHHLLQADVPQVFSLVSLVDHVYLKLARQPVLLVQQAILIVFMIPQTVIIAEAVQQRLILVLLVHPLNQHFNNIISLNISTDAIFFWILLPNFVIVVMDDCLS